MRKLKEVLRQKDLTAGRKNCIIATQLHYKMQMHPRRGALFIAFYLTSPKLIVLVKVTISRSGIQNVFHCLLIVAVD